MFNSRRLKSETSYRSFLLACIDPANIKARMSCRNHRLFACCFSCVIMIVYIISCHELSGHFINGSIGLMDTS